MAAEKPQLKSKIQKLKFKIAIQNLKFWILICNFAFCIFNFTLVCYAQDKIVAVVNDEVITGKDLAEFTAFLRVQLSREYSGEELERQMIQAQAGALDRLIEDRLIVQEAAKEKIRVDEARVRARLDEIRKRFSSDAEFQEDIARQGLTQADVESKIRNQLLMYAVVGLKVRDRIRIRPEEATAFYYGHQSEFARPEERQLQSIALQNEDQAKSFAYFLKIGQKLMDLAARYPVTVDRMKVNKDGELKKEIEEQIFQLPAGEASAPINIGGTYYVFIVENIQPSRQLSLAEAQEEVHNLLFEKKMQEEMVRWLDELKAKSYIKITTQISADEKRQD
jgi:parvulin-like peptidyl-prolyl isomerase